MNQEQREQAITNWLLEERNKLLKLCEYYGIPEGLDIYYKLAITLARELYPEPKKSGRKSKWPDLNKGALVVEVERLVMPDDPAHGVEWTCQQLAKREPWKSFINAKQSGATIPDPAEALRKIYYNFRDDKWASVIRNAYEWHKMQDKIDDWEKHVPDYVNNPYPK